MTNEACSILWEVNLAFQKEIGDSADWNHFV